MRSSQSDSQAAVDLSGAKCVARFSQHVGQSPLRSQDALVRESADVLYHLMVLWASTQITPDDIAAELARREGISGIDEKKGRKG